jgi:hypothetical protein
MSQAVTQKCSKIFNEAHVFLTDLFAFQDKYLSFIVFGLILALLLARIFFMLLIKLRYKCRDAENQISYSFPATIFIKIIRFCRWFMSVFDTTLEFFNKLLFLNIFLCYFLKDYFNSNSSEIPFLKHFNYFSFSIIILVLYFLPKEFDENNYNAFYEEFPMYVLALVYKFFVPMILFHFKSQMAGSFLFLIFSALLVFPTIAQEVKTSAYEIFKHNADDSKLTRY